MAAFKDDIVEWERLDYQILQNGWTNLYWKTYILNQDIEWFNKQNFDVVELDCKDLKDNKEILVELGRLLQFPDYYGRNLDAFNDCLSDIEIKNEGKVMVFRNFQLVAKEFAYSLLEIYADNARRHILFGKKLLILIQVDDPNYEITPIGSTPVLWNEAERLSSKRGL